ncbi:MAG: Snf7-domain-containing protein [Lentinula lateritia]|uniref:Snf7-domain-containing protein n=1 Tax=Lentinula lateritia TaxID=40482 RepID=A0ABQ8VNH6_9AGAR|nr:MAG: Snf7-domain-containing protein [Lentinula lateritia]KAJ4497942.1 Snf7-domain-containing protein [Lentinula lateritia]
MTSRTPTPYSSPYKSMSATISTPPFMSGSRYRLQSLYSDFSEQKRSNPASYQANVDWWRRTLETYVSEGFHGSNRLVLKAGQQLVDNFRVEGVGKPICFHAVLTELSSPPPSSATAVLPTLLPLTTFISLATSLYSSKSRSYLTVIPSFFLSYVVAKPLWWALEQVGVVGEDSLASSVSSTFSSFGSATSKTNTQWYGDYVLLHLVERAGNAILESQRLKNTGPSDALYTFDSFRTEFAECVIGSDSKDKMTMSELDMKVILRYLERDKGVVMVENGVVKFIEDDAEAEISGVDRGILELKTAVANLHAQIEGLQKKIDVCAQKAGEALKLKRKSIALSYLRSKKQLDDLLIKRLGALSNLEGTLIQVEGAAGDIEILNSYRASTATLRSILSHPSLNRDSIEQTMEAMAEANADAKEIDEAVRIGGDVAIGVTDFDDAELEEELHRLIIESGEEKQDELREMKLGSLPAAPLHDVCETSRTTPEWEAVAS